MVAMIAMAEKLRQQLQSEQRNKFLATFGITPMFFASRVIIEIVAEWQAGSIGTFRDTTIREAT